MSTSARPDPLIGRLVDERYRVRARVARGGMATVYVATDLRLERRVALKVMHSHLSDDAVFQNRFIQEARAAARLADPHVVSVFDQGRDDDMAYLVMEYLPGITLRELMRDQKRLPLSQTVTIMDAVLSGLAAAHRAGIIHRDVKPENVLLAEDGRIKIGDFGLARAATAHTASGQMLLGTIAYLAPELVTRGTADARSDIYSLGIMLYELLTGEQPYKGEQPMQIAYQHATSTVPRPSVRNAAVPEQLDELVLWATERSPDDRPKDAGEMLTRLREIEQQLGLNARSGRLPVSTVTATLDSGDVTSVLPAATTPLGSTRVMPATDPDNAASLRAIMRRRARRGRWLVACVLLLALLAGGTGGWFGSGPGSKVEVPSVAGMLAADARAALERASLVVTEVQDFSPDVAADHVISSDPGAHTRVDKHATVTITVSKGPRSSQLPALAGLTEQEARQDLQQAGLVIADSAYQFTTTPDGTVLSATVTPRGSNTPSDCSQGCTVHEGDGAALTVSLGPVPNVAGKSIADATSILTAKKLLVSGNYDQQYSDTVDAGTVIGIDPRKGGGNWQLGDTVTLIVSKGPQLFPVPNVVGMTLTDAKKTLIAAGFTPAYSAFWDVAADIAKVTSQSPDSTSSQRKGTKINLVVSFTG